ncbi:flavin-nucleotide-binding protein [Marinomonas sp. SBI22]|uniref:pyridoxamine 5'-phosphate oxidase family protein n=1 Tax=unclassified Marinomonas TaxID=196814 RepID=UPI0007AF9957|nr:MULTISPECIES: pyridoxamine 5'-phosphate oxidase family protein [unclassified Marinomonas]KZM40272.1 flavin-nucleotide-binding protein [Marinomonas sp. SBI22]KZM41689.1 flavin-nucleotide-binding protein [Marinomonas sp. SBI8L]
MSQSNELKTDSLNTSSLKTEKSKVRRGAKRASYDKETMFEILDASLMCHVAQSINGQPFVVPTCHWRDGDYFYWHGLASARNVKNAVNQAVCINVTHLDGLVMARSAMHHSVNYRSVTLFGTPETITDPVEKERQLKIFLDKVSPSRWEALRPVNEQELKATGLVRIPINEASTKVRAEPPVDDEEDYDWPVWAGVIPLEQSWGQAETDPRQVVDFERPKLPDAF